jgi:hypothetical protein
MAEPVPPVERAASNADGAAVKLHALPVRLIASAAHWATASKLRMAIGGGVGLAALAAMLAVWSYIAHLAVSSLEPVSLGEALAALDAGRNDEARALIGDMQEQVATPALVGGARRVLGAMQGRSEASLERRTAMYLLAGRHLKAHAHGARGSEPYRLFAGQMPSRRPAAGCGGSKMRRGSTSSQPARSDAMLVRG